MEWKHFLLIQLLLLALGALVMRQDGAGRVVGWAAVGNEAR